MNAPGEPLDRPDLSGQVDYLDLAMETAAFGTWEVDFLKGIRTWSQEGQAIVGAAHEIETLTADFQNSIHPDDRQRVADATARALDPAGNGRYWAEYRLLDPAGGPDRWVAARARVSFDETGKPLRMAGVTFDIEARKRAEEELRESAARFRRVFDQSPLGKATAGPDGKFREINPALCRMLGYEADELTQLGFLDLVHPDDREPCIRSASMLAAGEVQQFQLEERFLTKSGETIWVSVNVGAITDSAGKMLYSLGIIEDITERRHSEQALRDSQERFRTMLRAMPHIAFIVDRNGTVTYNNARYDEYVGTHPDILDDDARMAIVHPDDRPALIAAREVGRAEGRDYSYEARLRRHDGVYRWHSVQFRPLLHEGAVEEWFGMAVDIDDIRQARDILARRVEERTQELTASRAQVQMFYDYSTECHTIIQALDDGHFLYEEANPAVLRLYGKTREEVVGHTVSEVFGADHAAEIEAQLTACLLADGPYRYVRTQGGAIVEATGTRVPQEEGQPRRLIVTARDVTESRRLEDQLRQAQKMETVGQLTGGVAHDFNNMLTIVVGNLDLLERRLDDENLRRMVASARRGADQAATLTHRLLAFSRKQPLDPRQVDLNKLVSSMSEMLRRSIGEAVAIETVLAGGLWLTNTDPNQLENALLNLALNARDAMVGGGHLTIETANTYLDETYVKAHPDVTAGQYAMLAVSDTGTGMSAETIEKAFEPFFTTKDVGAGSGLGLSMVYGFVKQSGGHIKIYSEIGQGTTIKLYFPRIVGAMATASQVEQAPMPGGLDEETILVVEDNEDVREYSLRVLKDLGYRTLEAHDAAEALGLLSSGTRIDLLFTDVGLPGGVSGRALADQARERRPGLKVLFTTGYARNAIVHNGTLDPGVQLIGKPWTQRDIAIKIRSVLDAAPIDMPKV